MINGKETKSMLSKMQKNKIWEKVLAENPP